VAEAKVARDSCRTSARPGTRTTTPESAPIETRGTSVRIPTRAVGGGRTIPGVGEGAGALLAGGVGTTPPWGPATRTVRQLEAANQAATAAAAQAAADLRTPP
jgi:hypothetical protein